MWHKCPNRPLPIYSLPTLRAPRCFFLAQLQQPERQFVRGGQLGVLLGFNDRYHITFA